MSFLGDRVCGDSINAIAAEGREPRSRQAAKIVFATRSPASEAHYTDWRAIAQASVRKSANTPRQMERRGDQWSRRRVTPGAVAVQAEPSPRAGVTADLSQPLRQCPPRLLLAANAR
jgi:hypothetical protein